jgi:hypothetical protein
LTCVQRVLAILLAITASAIAGPVRKPSAPVQVTIESRPVAGGYVVTLVAVPTRAVPAVELEVAGKSLVFGATAAGQRRVLVTRVVVPAGAGVDLVGSAAAANRNKAVVLRVGAPKAEAPKRGVTRTLPDGREVEEIR